MTRLLLVQVHHRREVHVGIDDLVAWTAEVEAGHHTLVRWPYITIGHFAYPSALTVILIVMSRRALIKSNGAPPCSQRQTGWLHTFPCVGSAVFFLEVAHPRSCLPKPCPQYWTL